MKVDLANLQKEAQRRKGKAIASGPPKKKVPRAPQASKPGVKIVEG